MIDILRKNNLNLNYNIKKYEYRIRYINILFRNGRFR